MVNLHRQARGGSRRTKSLCFGCWNMRTLVEQEGPVITAVTRKSGRVVAVDKKTVFMVQEFRNENC